MDNQQRSTSSAPASARASQAPAAEPASQGMRAKAEDAVAKLTDVAQQAGNQAKQTASSMAADATKGAKGFLNSQVAASADLAESVRSAADKLASDAPQIAGLVRGAADGVERFSRDLRDQSVEDLWRSASDFTRKQPALVFGLASLAGFLLFRVLKADSAEAGGHRQSYPRGPRVGEHSRQAYGP